MVERYHAPRLVRYTVPRSCAPLLTCSRPRRKRRMKSSGLLPEKLKGMRLVKLRAWVGVRVRVWVWVWVRVRVWVRVWVWVWG